MDEFITLDLVTSNKMSMDVASLKFQWIIWRILTKFLLWRLVLFVSTSQLQKKLVPFFCALTTIILWIANVFLFFGGGLSRLL